MADKDALFTSGRTGEIDRDEWRTPIWLYNTLDQEFYFDLDAAATDENSLTDWYFDKESDGLKSNWWGNVFVNPPYSQLKKWVQKGFEEARDNPLIKNVVMLVPARTDTQAWWQYIRFGEVRFLPGRLRFGISDAAREKVIHKNLDRIRAGKVALDPENTSAPFPSAIVIFRGYGKIYQPQTIYWNIRESAHANSVQPE